MNPIIPVNGSNAKNAKFDPAPTASYLQKKAYQAPILSQEVFGKPLTGGVEAFPTLDVVLGLAKTQAAPEAKENIVTTFGAYLGETLRSMHGGEWTEDPDAGWCIKNVGAPGERVNPFEWVKDGNIAGHYEAWCRQVQSYGKNNKQH
ncbi:MAG TPA: hypothetical protein VNZ52_12930 [Candidatus Thermoplasmatota archaeon]|nr:hypothetical protein [Candidatus Thermoplasmatota archaeon]